MIDISKHKRLEALKISNAIQQKFILGEHEDSAFFPEILSHLLKLSESEFGFMGQLCLNRDKPYLKILATTKVTEDHEGSSVNNGESIPDCDFLNTEEVLQLTLKQNEACFYNDNAIHPALARLAKGHINLQSLFCHPIRRNNQTLGIVCLANTVDNYDEETLNLLAPLLDTCSVFIQAAEAKHNDKPDTSNKTLPLPSDDEKPGSNWEWNLEKKQHSIPEKIYKLQGWKQEDLPGSLRQFFSSFVHPEDQTDILRHLRVDRYLSKGYTVQCRLRNQRDEYRWYKLGVQLVLSQAGELHTIHGTIKDIHRMRSGIEKNQHLYDQSVNLQEKLNSSTHILRQNLMESREIRQQLKENKNLFKSALRIYDESVKIYKDSPQPSGRENQKNLDFDQNNQLIEERQRLTERLSTLSEELESNLQESEELRKKVEARDLLLKNAINIYNDVFIVFDSDRRIKFINHSGLSFLGMKEEDVVGKRDEDFLPREITRTYLPTLKKAYKLKKEQTLEVSFSTPNGNKEVSIRYIPHLDKNGDVYELVAITFDITQHKQAQLETLKAKEQYQYLFHHSPLPMWIYDLETLQFMDINEAATYHYGWTREEFLKMNIRDIRSLDEKQRLKKFQTGKISNYSNSGIWKHQRKDGSQIDVEITSHEFVFKGRKARIVLANDVSDRLKAERMLQESEANLKASLDNGILSLVLLDRDGKVVLTDRKTNQLAAHIFGKEMEPGADYTEFLPPRQIEEFHHNFNKALQGKTSRFERIVDHGESGKFELDVSYSPVTDTHGQVNGVVISFLDISERRKAQMKLAESEANLKAIFDATSHSYFLVDKDYTILKFNKLAATAVWMSHGIELKEGENMLDFSDPQLLESFKDSVQRALLGEKISGERRINHPLEEKWYHVQYLPVSDDTGKIYGVAFVAEDITRSKQTELALQKSYRDVQNFKNALYNSALISVTDLEGKIIEVNDKFCEVSKYNREELIRSPHRVVNSGYHTHEFFKTMWDTIKQGNIWRGDIKNKAKDGTYYWVDTFIHPIKDENGDINHYLSVRYLITDRKEAEEQTQRYALRLDDILENITDGFFTVDREWRFTRVNNVLEKSLRKKREELIGVNIWDTFPEAVKLKFYAEYSKTMDKGEAVHFEEYFPPLDTWFEAHAYPAEDGISVYFRDITQRKKSEAEIMKLSLVASKTDNAVIITNARREIEWVNEGFTKLTNYRFEEVIGRNPGHFLQGPETNQATVDRIRLKLTKNEPLTEELINYNKKGEKYWIKLDINPILNQEGEAEKFIAIQSNITQRKFAELEKAQLLEELIQKNKSLEEYAFITSHNLRAPIAHILGLTSLFNEVEIDDPFNVTLIKQLSKASENLDSIIKDITELLAIRKDIVKVKEQVRLNEVVEKVMENLQDQINDTGAVMKLKLEAVKEIFTVKDFLYSILLNLMSNAIKYRHPGRQPEIEISAVMENDQKYILIKDNGLGIDLNKYGKKIFSLYSRFHSHVEGKGMGLHLVKTLAEAAGGSVQVESEVGKGSTFFIIFPNE